MRAIAKRGLFFGMLSEEQKAAGYIKFNIPNVTKRYELNGEGVWGWVFPEDHAKYDNDNYTGKIKAILLNDPLCYNGLLQWGNEVVLKCNGPNRPTLDPEWVEYCFLGAEIPKKCEACVINDAVANREFPGCAWYIDNVILGGKSIEDCEDYV